MAQSSKAMIIIGDRYLRDPVKESECDVYYYPENITEWELADEVEHLAEFYAELAWPIWWPQHIRLEKIKKWVEELTLGCEWADRKTGLPQCNIFCKFYHKGGCSYAKK